MMRKLLLGMVCVSASAATSLAGQHYHFPAPVMVAPPVVYSAPVVTYQAYQPAYAVPMTTGGYYAPMVPAVPRYTAPRVVATHYLAPSAVYAPSTVYAPAPVVVPASVHPQTYSVHGRPYYVDPRGRLRRYRGIDIEIEHDGDIEIDYR